MQTPPSSEPNRENVDATRRTFLASERTYLAWWRTGLTALALSFAAGKLVPGFTTVTEWPYEALGVGYGALGFFTFGYGLYRQRSLDAALRRGEYAAIGYVGTVALTVAGVVLGLLTIAVVVFA